MMMRKMPLFVLIFFSLVIRGQAIETEEIIGKQKDALNLDRVEKAAEPYLGKLKLDEIQLEEGLEIILDTGMSEMEGIWRRVLRGGVALLAIVFLECVASSIENIGKSNSLSVISLATALGITALSVSDVKSLIGLGGETMEKMTDFANILFPSITALTAATGAITGGAFRQTAVLLFTDIVMNLMTHFLVPMIYAYIALSVAHAAVGNEGIKRVAALIKWTLGIVLSAILTAFVGYLTIGGAIAGQADKAALKTAKFAFSSAIPVVGKLLADAAESVLAGIGILKGTIGLYGMLTVLAICVTPFLRLGVHYLAYKLTAALASTVGESRTVALIDSIGTAFGFILGMAGAEMLLLILAVASAFSVVSL